MYLQSKEREIISIVLFSADLTSVATGRHRSSQKRVLFTDTQNNGRVVDDALALEVLKKRAGIREGETQFVERFESRRWYTMDRRGAVESHFLQHTFLAVATPDCVLGEKKAGDSVTECRFDPLPRVLLSWDLPEADPNKMKVNMVCILVRSLLFLEGLARGNTAFVPFQEMLYSLKNLGIRLQSYERQILGVTVESRRREKKARK